MEIKKETEYKGKNVIVGIYSKGALCILDDSLRKVTAVALEDVSLAIITQENLDKLIDTNPGLAAKLLKGMLITVSDRSDLDEAQNMILFVRLNPVMCDVHYPAKNVRFVGGYTINVFCDVVFGFYW